MKKYKKLIKFLFIGFALYVAVGFFYVLNNETKTIECPRLVVEHSLKSA